MKFAQEAHNILKKSKINGYRTDIEEQDILNNYSYIWQEVNDLLIKIKENIGTILIGYDNCQIPAEEQVGIHKFMPETEVK